MIVRPAVPEDAVLFAPVLRRVDAVELHGALGVDTAAGLEQSIRVSTWAESLIDSDGTPIYLYGLARWPDGTGCPWMMATEYLKLRMPRRAFLAHSVAVVARMASDATALANYVAADNKIAKRWLAWLGFTILPEEVQMRPGGIPFNLFFMESQCAPRR